MTDAEREEWNEALASGDEVLINRLQRENLDRIYTRIMNDDLNYATAGWTS